MRVNEIFASFQGEYPCGLPALFIRLQGCNQQCSFCDTTYAQDPDYGGREMSIEEVARTIVQSGRRHIVWTGGEPMLQWKEIREILLKLQHLDLKWNIETNGTVYKRIPAEFWAFFEYIVVSPKTEVVANNWVHNKRAILKIVVDASNEEEFQRWIDWFTVKHTQCDVLFMPLSKCETQTSSHEFANLQCLIERLRELNLPIGFSPRMQRMFSFK